MNTKPEQADFEPVARRLAEEARAAAPSFSPMLHERLMREVRRAQAAPVRQETSWFGRRYAVAAAALIAVAVASVVSWHVLSGRRAGGGSSGTHQVVAATHPLPPFPSVTESLATAIEPIEQRLGEAKYGYLDRDARRLADFVADQLDVLPTNARSPRKL